MIAAAHLSQRGQKLLERPAGEWLGALAAAVAQLGDPLLRSACVLLRGHLLRSRIPSRQRRAADMHLR